MQIQFDIPFDQLVRIVKNLPVAQQKKLKSEIDKEAISKDLEAILLNGPVGQKTNWQELLITEKLSINGGRK